MDPPRGWKKFNSKNFNIPKYIFKNHISDNMNLPMSWIWSLKFYAGDENVLKLILFFHKKGMNVLLITEICQSIQCGSHAVFSAFLLQLLRQIKFKKPVSCLFFYCFLCWKTPKFIKLNMWKKPEKNLFDNAVFRRKKFVKKWSIMILFALSYFNLAWNL